MLHANRPVWEISDMSDSETLKGDALYNALIRIKPNGLAETDWAVQAGVNRGWFTNLKGSDISPRADNLRKILNYIGKTEADLRSQNDRDNSRDYGTHSYATLQEIASEHGIAFVEEVDLALGMGATYLHGEPEVIGLVPFREDWLRDVAAGSVDRLKVVRGRGDSMQPTILDGDIVLVDTGHRTIDDQDRIWALAYGDLGVIRRVRVTPRGSWLLMPDNQVVRPDEVTDGEASVIGRVIWIGRRI